MLVRQCLFVLKVLSYFETHRFYTAFHKFAAAVEAVLYNTGCITTTTSV